MNELDHITVRGFKSIASMEELQLGPITVIIGANGSGKSNFIGVFSFLNSLREGRLRQYVIKEGGADKILHFGSRITDQLHIGLSFQGGINQYEITLQADNADGLVPLQEEGRLLDQTGRESPYWLGVTVDGKEARISEARGQVAASVRQHLDRWRPYHFHDTSPKSPLQRTARVNDNRFLRPDGSNLASFLYLIREKYEASYNLITSAIRQVAPFFYDFVLEPQRLNPGTILLEWTHTGTDSYFDASALSDGTLRFMALATLFLQPQELKPSVILVDEPELGLHPYAITLVASLIKQASTESQVIVCTQSSLLLDHFEPEDVVVAERIDGATQFNRLDSSRLESWLERYSLGQLWEKNELGGRPKRE